MRLQEIDALIIDIDGTLFLGDEPLPGVARLFTFLGEHGIDFVVVSNNSTQSPAHYQKKLLSLGAAISAKEILTSSLVAAAYLQTRLPASSQIYAIGEASLCQSLRDAGFVLMADAREPVDAVVVGGDMQLTYDKLKHAALLLQAGARLVGTNPDLLCPTAEGLVPEAGTTLAALEAATGVRAEIVGKPAPYLFERAVAITGCSPHRTAMIGDRLETDIEGAQRVGLRTILVTTGVDNERTVLEKSIEPDLVVSGLDKLVGLWATALN